MFMSYVPDNLDIWSAYDREQCQAAERLSRCSECDEPITTEMAYYINGEWICEECMEQYHIYLPEM